jgi:hypothetical protein
LVFSLNAGRFKSWRKRDEPLLKTRDVYTNNTQGVAVRFRRSWGDSGRCVAIRNTPGAAVRSRLTRGVSKHRDAFQKIARRSKAPRGVLVVSRENCFSHWIDRVKFIGKCRYKYYQRFTIFHLHFCKIKISYFCI